jgi:pyruvate/2-oxoglutarate dehydrogenase complex dihydrolipoamide acyltransferase (E2) component
MRLNRRHFLTRALSLALALGLINLLSACATIINGRTQTVLVQTDPPGRIVRFEGARVADGETLTVRKKFKTPKFEVGNPDDPVLINMGYTPSVWVLGDAALAIFFVIPGLIAGGVDAGTGAWRYLNDPQVVTIPGSTSSAATASEAEPTPAEAAAPSPAPTPTPPAAHAPYHAVARRRSRTRHPNPASRARGGHRLLVRNRRGGGEDGIRGGIRPRGHGGRASDPAVRQRRAGHTTGHRA